MGAISLTGNAIYSQNINNFSGELFRVGGQRTPFLSATGGLNGGKVLQSTFWQIQAADNAVVSSKPTKVKKVTHQLNISVEIELLIQVSHRYSIKVSR